MDSYLAKEVGRFKITLLSNWLGKTAGIYPKNQPNADQYTGIIRLPILGGSQNSHNMVHEFWFDNITGWWRRFQIFFISLLFGKEVKHFTSIFFQIGCFNHQPDNDPCNVKHTVDGRNPAPPGMYKTL